MNLLFGSLIAVFTAPLAAAPVDFAKDIQPLFSKHCVSCHGTLKQKAGLRLETGQQVLKGSLNGPIVIAKKSADSPLVHVLNGLTDVGQMPPTGPLADDEIKLVARWIDEGAIVPATTTVVKHWAFEKPQQLPVPDKTHPVDHFLALERVKKGIVAAPSADRTTLLVRLSLDLTGLPPSPNELESFLNDTSADAYEKRVEALLASPRYGERWGRHFLDIWRYSDWYGFGGELRNSQKHIWNWRDWTVDAFNANKPYGDMIREMLAGDEIAPLDPNVVRATGFLARSYYKFNRNVWLDSIVEHTGKAFLGITLNCCRCHDHMYDPFSQEEYFRFRAIFEPHQVRLDYVPGETDPEKRGLPRVFDADLKAVTFLFERGDEKRPVKEKALTPGVPSAIQPTLFSPKENKLPVNVTHPTLNEPVRFVLMEQARKAIEAAKSEPRKQVAILNLRAVQAKLNADQVRYTKPSPALIRHAVSLHLEAALSSVEADLIEAEESLKKIESAPKKDEKAVAAARKTVADVKGKVDAARKAFENPSTDYPPLMASYPEITSGRRTALADWITSKDNPLTARVLVNHLWLRHFGRPLVPSVFDFGKNGRPPTNPALLDWLAVEFVKSNGNIKQMHRLMVTSEAYKMASSFANESNRAIDPDNRLHWKMNPRPLEAEAIRDRLLFVSGLLNETRGGPELDFNDDAPTQRRSLYYRHAPEKMMPFLVAFDNPSPTECYRRPETVVPQQAMALVNSRLSHRAAETIVLTTNHHRDWLESTYQRILGRSPNSKEVALCESYLASHSPESLVQALFNHADFSTIR